MEFLIPLLIFLFVAILAGRLSGSEDRNSVEKFEGHKVWEEGENYITRSMFDNSDDEFFNIDDDYGYEDDVADPTKCYLPYNIYHDSCFGDDWDSFSNSDHWDDLSSNDFDAFQDDW